MTVEPTIRELVIRLEVLSKDLGRITGLLERGEYLRRDVYDSNHRALRSDLEALRATTKGALEKVEKEIEDQEKFRRQVWTSLLMLLLGFVVSLVLWLVQGSTGGVGS